MISKIDLYFYRFSIPPFVSFSNYTSTINTASNMHHYSKSQICEVRGGIEKQGQMLPCNKYY
jgi:hypothetical protein